MRALMNSLGMIVPLYSFRPFAALATLLSFTFIFPSDRISCRRMKICCNTFSSWRLCSAPPFALLAQTSASRILYCMILRRLSRIEEQHGRICREGSSQIVFDAQTSLLQLQTFHTLMNSLGMIVPLYSFRPFAALATLLSFTFTFPSDRISCRQTILVLIEEQCDRNCHVSMSQKVCPV